MSDDSSSNNNTMSDESYDSDSENSSKHEIFLQDEYLVATEEVDKAIADSLCKLEKMIIAGITRVPDANLANQTEKLIDYFIEADRNRMAALAEKKQAITNGELARLGLNATGAGTEPAATPNATGAGTEPAA